MRISHAMLMQNARRLAEQRAAADHSIICVYLTGAMLHEDQRIGGVGDLDMVFVHAGMTANTPHRELLRLSEELHFDMVHLPQELYRDPKQLRRSPWVGADVWQKPLVFFEKNHWFDFTLAGAFSQFDSVENTLLRAQSFLNSAREEMQTVAFHPSSEPAIDLFRYLRALEDGANALAVLNGSPLSTRRLLLDFPARAAALDQPLNAHKPPSAHVPWTVRLIDQFSQGGIAPTETLQRWLEGWQRHCETLPVNPPLELHLLKQHYYNKAVLAFSEELPAAALWILLRCWNAAVLAHNPAPGAGALYTELLTACGLNEEALDDRFGTLDTLLDEVSDLLDARAAAEGLPELAAWTQPLFLGRPQMVDDWTADWADVGGR